jgi:hypothetical protein
MTFCLPFAYYREHLQRKEREEKRLAEPLLEVGGAGGGGRGRGSPAGRQGRQRRRWTAGEGGRRAPARCCVLVREPMLASCHLPLFCCCPALTPSPRHPTPRPEQSDAASSAPESGSLKETLLLSIPSFFDLVATILMNIGLLSVTASVYQMMRGAEMLFAALFAIAFLQRRLNRFHLYGILCCVVRCVRGRDAPRRRAAWRPGGGAMLWPMRQGAGRGAPLAPLGRGCQGEGHSVRFSSGTHPRRAPPEGGGMWLCWGRRGPKPRQDQ